MTDPAILARRDLLQGSAVAVALGILSGCHPDRLPDTPKVRGSATGIDVHCHVFNARDLPVPGFVLHVVLEEYQALLNVPLGPLVTMLSLIADWGIRSADSEIQALQSGEERPYAMPPRTAGPTQRDLREKALLAAQAMQSPRPDARSQAVIDQVRTLLARTPGSGVVAPLAAPIAPSRSGGPAEVDSFLSTVAQLSTDAPLAGAAPRPFAAPAAPRSREQLAAAAAQGVERHAANQSGVFYLADRLAQPRAALVIALAGLPQQPDPADIAMFTPALIDFSYWLDSQANSIDDPDPTADPVDVTPLADQVAVMSVIAGLNRSGTSRRPYAVHPFVSFCPWRQIAWEKSGSGRGPNPFEVGKQSIQDKGFIGFKLYPLMGFRPTGNAGQAASAYPARLRRLDDWAAGLDRVLADLYTWCVAEDVPIMAHCSFSQYPSVAAGRLGGPSAWWEVLANPRFRTLRLNLAHCGGVWDLDVTRAASVASLAGSLWPAEVVARLGAEDRPPNLYADLSDFSTVDQCVRGHPSPAGTAVAALEALVAAAPRARERLMYGTDYMFLTIAPHSEGYLREMRDCLAPNLGLAPGDLMGGNAARFLGLTNARSATRQRLDRFRKDDFLSRWETFATA